MKTWLITIVYALISRIRSRDILHDTLDVNHIQCLITPDAHFIILRGKNSAKILVVQSYMFDVRKLHSSSSQVNSYLKAIYFAQKCRKIYVFLINSMSHGSTLLELVDPNNLCITLCLIRK